MTTATVPKRDAEPGAEKRVAPRRRVIKSAKVTFADFVFARECSVVNISETGARISIVGPHEIPDDFYLILLGERTMYRAKVRWRKGNFMGLAFDGEPRDITSDPDPRLKQFKFL